MPNNSHFTPEQIQEILDLYFENFAHRQYIGARYVPIFGRKDEDSIEWDSTGTYEPLTIVLYQGNSYTSRQFVPVGVEITNETYWANTGNYNAQVEAYRQEVVNLELKIPGNEFDSTNTVKKYIDDKVNILYAEKAQCFDTVQDMKDYTGLQVGMFCHTNGFHTSGDGGAAWYKISDTGTANEMDVIACGELFANLVITNDYVTPEMFGAYGDGNHDDGNSMRECFNKSKNIVANGLYKCTGYITKTLLNASRDFILVIKDGTKISGNGKFLFPNDYYNQGSGAFGGVNYFYGDEFTLDGITIDMNGSNNIVPDTTLGVTYTTYAIYSDVCKGITIENCKFFNSDGRNFIYIQHGDKCCIKNTMFKNGAPSISGNLQNDFSYIFSCANHTTCDNVTILPPNVEPNIWCGGIEIHGDESTVCNCVLNACNPGIYVANSPDSSIIDNIIINGNSIVNSKRGIVLFEDTTINNIVISNNVIEISNYGYSSATSEAFIINAIVNNLTISENVISGTNANRLLAFVQLNDFIFANNQIDGFKDMIYGKLDADCENLKIIGNYFGDTSKIAGTVSAIFIEPTSTTDTKIKELRVKDNEFNDYFSLNATTFIDIDTCKIYCEKDNIRDSVVSSGIFYTENYFAISSATTAWIAKLIGKQAEIYAQEIELTDSLEIIRMPFAFDLTEPYYLNVDGYNLVSAHEVVVNNLVANGINMRSTETGLHVYCHFFGTLLLS